MREGVGVRQSWHPVCTAGPARISGDTKIVRVRLDPTECELRALFDNLDRHQQNVLKRVTGSMKPENAHQHANW